MERIAAGDGCGSASNTSSGRHRVRILREVLARSEHRHAVDAIPDCRRVVVHEADGAIAVPGLCFMSRTMSSPAGPAPNIKTPLVGLARDSSADSLRVMRTPPRSSINTKASTMKRIDRG